MLNNEELFIDTKKIKNGSWDVFVKHIPTGLNYSYSDSKIQKENLNTCKEVVEDMLKFYNFCTKREMSWNDGELVFLLDNEDINEFIDLVGENYFCEGDIKVTLMGYYIGFDLIPFCEWLNIEPEILLKKERSV